MKKYLILILIIYSAINIQAQVWDSLSGGLTYTNGMITGAFKALAQQGDFGLGFKVTFFVF